MTTSTTRRTQDARGAAPRGGDEGASKRPMPGGASQPGRACPFASHAGALPPIDYRPEDGTQRGLGDAALAFDGAVTPVYESSRALHERSLLDNPAFGRVPSIRTPEPARPASGRRVQAAEPAAPPARDALPAHGPDGPRSGREVPSSRDAATPPSARVQPTRGSVQATPLPDPVAAAPAAPAGDDGTQGLAQMPRQRSLPLIGNSLRYLREGGALLTELHATHGELVRYDTFGRHWIGLHGADANQLVFRDAPDAFSSDAWGLLLDGLFEHGMIRCDGDIHRRHRDHMAQAFSPQALAAYLGTIQGAALTALERWPQGRSVQVYPRLKQMTLDIAIEVFTGMTPGNDTRRVTEAFSAMCRGITAIVRMPWPGTRWRRALHARRELEHWLGGLLRMRRDVPGNDLLSRLCMSASPDEDPIPDSVIIDQMLSLLMASHDTVTCALTGLMYQLGRDGTWRRRLRRHSMALVNPCPDHAGLNGLKKMEWAVKESLRLLPPQAALPRRTTREVTFKQWRIPADHLVTLSPWATHHDPALWTDPDRFDPDRFSPARSEHTRHPFQWVPFGGGAHQCLGMHFGLMEIKAILHLLLTRIDWAVAPDYEMPLDFSGIPAPRDGLPVALRKLG